MSTRDIVFATDFSPCAERAFDVAVELARALGARLRIVHALFDPLPNVLLTATYVPPSQEELQDLSREAERQLERLALQAERQSVTVVTAVDRGGAAAETVIDHAARNHAGLLVIGTHGRGRTSQVLLGSVALDVIRTAPCPVLAIRADHADRRLGAPKHILVAFDFSPLARRMLEWTAELARHTGAEIELLHVPEDVGILGEGHDDDRHRLELRLEDIAESVGHGLPIVVNMQAGRPAAVIRERVASGGMDWVALGTHGYSGLQRLFYGSTAEEVLRSAEVPVLLINRTALVEESRLNEPAVAVAGSG